MSIELKVPPMGESITEVEIGEWLKKEGDTIAADENVVVLESEKATVELPAPSGGTVQKILKKKGETARVGETIAQLEQNGAGTSNKPAASAPAPTAAPEPKKSEKAPTAEEPARVMPAAQRVLEQKKISPDAVTGTGPGGRILKEDVEKVASPSAETQAVPAPSAAAAPAGDRQEEIVPMSRLRRTIMERLQAVQQQAVLLTTINEIDMSAVMGLRKEFGEAFLAKHKIKLGFMSFFVKAVIDALKEIPELNAEIREKSIVYKNYFDIGVAIGGGKGLVVPVLRHADRMSFAQIEQTIGELAGRARENKLKLEELQGGTFTITNGGVYGSLLSTPLINPPQSGILGMHSIQDRPVVREGQIVIRPMMYVALTYDHAIVDGREAVTFLKRIKDNVENPSRMLLEL